MGNNKGDDQGLLTREELDEIFKAKGIILSIGQGKNIYENLEIATKGQRDLTKQETNIPKDMIAWILKRLNGKDASDFMLAISTGKLLDGGK